MTCVRPREARGEDIEAIREIFLLAYGPEYPYAQFYNVEWLKRAVYGNDMVMLVAEEDETGKILGTGSVVFDVGTHSDLIGEFGRLAVHPDARGKGVGKIIMAYRLKIIEERLHVGIVENRTHHAFSQKISSEAGFVPVGFLPLKHCFEERESIALYMRHFGAALELRRNHPRVVPEVGPLAHLVMSQLQMLPDVIIDESSPAYPHDSDFVTSRLVAEGLPALLRIERGRVRSREVYGPMRLHHGFFKLAASHADYLVARRPGAPQEAIAGAMGFLHDETEASMRIFEVIAATDDAIRHLFEEALKRARELAVQYIEVEVSAHGTRLQRTLIELGFLPAAYLPAMVFQDVERLDVIKMVRLLIPPVLAVVELIDAARPVFDLVMQGFEVRAVLPKIAESIGAIALFEGLSDEQARRLAGAMTVESFDAGEVLFEKGAPAREVFIILEGKVDVTLPTGVQLGSLGQGRVVGENATLAELPHSARAVAKETTSVAVLARTPLETLARRRPDIAVILYRNLAIALGKKLRGADEGLEEARSS